MTDDKKEDGAESRVVCRRTGEKYSTLALKIEELNALAKETK